MKVAGDFYSDFQLSNRPCNVSRHQIGGEHWCSMYNYWRTRRLVEDMSRGNAPGEDGITAQLIKHGGDIISRKLASLFKKFTKASSVPLIRKKANIILMLKKCYMKELNNYRPISLRPVIYQLVTKVICARIREALEFDQPRKQCGFTRRYSTMHHSYAIRQICEAFTKYNITSMALMDYDSIWFHRNSSNSRGFKSIGVRDVYAETISNMCKDCTVTLLLLMEDRNFFAPLVRGGKIPISRGVIHGATIFPMLFPGEWGFVSERVQLFL